MDLADKYRDARCFERTLTLAWTQAQVQLHHLGIGSEEAHLFQRLASSVIYSDATLRPTSEFSRKTNVDIATFVVAGDFRRSAHRPGADRNEQDLEMIRQLLRAHEYWRMKHLPVDVVIINEKPPSYLQDLQGSLETLVHGSQLRLLPDTTSPTGRIFLLRGDLVSPQTRAQLQSVARVVLLGRRGTLAEQIGRSRQGDSFPVSPRHSVRSGKRTDVTLPNVPLEFPNGLGGFAENGREYVTILSEGLRTPEPWVNVIANPDFGFLVSESGSGFTWSVNSHENQLTPWSNDHVMDTPGEVIYVRDDATGELWTPTALPIRDEAASYIARHGQGYSRFQQARAASCSTWCNSWLRKTRLKSPGLPFKITRLGPAAFPSPLMSNGCSVAHGPLPSPTWSPNSINRPDRFLPAAPGVASFRAALLLWILPESKLPIRVIEPNSWAAMAHWNVPPVWNWVIRFPETLVQASILAQLCKPQLNCVPARARNLCFSWDKPNTGKNRAN